MTMPIYAVDAYETDVGLIYPFSDNEAITAAQLIKFMEIMANEGDACAANGNVLIYEKPFNPVIIPYHWENWQD